MIACDTWKRTPVRFPDAVHDQPLGGTCVVLRCLCCVRRYAREPDPGANLGSAEKGKKAKLAALLDKNVGVQAAYLFE